VAVRKNPPGRPRGAQIYEPTQEKRMLALYMSATGCPLGQIAREIGCNERTLRKYYKDELTNGHDAIVSKIAVGVVSRAMRAFTAREQPGDLSCARWYMGLHGGAQWKMNARENEAVNRLEQASGVNEVQVYIPDNHRDRLEEVEAVTIEGKAEDTSEAA